MKPNERYDHGNRHDYNGRDKHKRRPKHANLKPKHGGKSPKWSDHDHSEFYKWDSLNDDER